MDNTEDTMPIMAWLWDFAAWYWCFVVVHELCHLIAACCLGFAREALTASNARSSLLERCVVVKGVSGWKEKAIRHAGWIGSLAISLFLFTSHPTSASTFASLLAAADSICSDLFHITVPHIAHSFHCGNFGLLILDKKNRSKVMDILKTMVRVTMVRGAQSGGVVTYVPNGKSLKGIRSRVVNGKRTDLSDLVVSAAKKDQLLASMRYGLLDGPRIYAGHTRFATTSKATLDGTHPHQWTKPVMHLEHVAVDGVWQAAKKSVEVFISHNGDFDSFEVGGVTRTLEDLQGWIARATHTPMASSVDSMCVAGMFDLLRCKGVWYHSLRFALLFGVKHPDLSYTMPSKKEFMRVANMADQAFTEIVASVDRSHNTFMQSDEWLRRAVTQRFTTLFADGVFGLDVESGTISTFVEAAAAAFFEMDLLASVQYFLSKAKGSFGLCVSCSLDADRQVCLAARGQTMSVAFYPRLGMVLWGSEQAALKAALPEVSEQSGDGRDAVRIDLDDLGGEACLLEFGWTGAANMDSTINGSFLDSTINGSYPFSLDSTICPSEGSPLAALRGASSPLRSAAPAESAPQDRSVSAQVVPASPIKAASAAGLAKNLGGTSSTGTAMDGTVKITLVQETGSKLKAGPLAKRYVEIETNPLIPRLPKMLKDPVGHEIRDIPRVLSKMQQHWADNDTLNNITAFWFCSALCKRLRMHAEGKHEGGIDLLITGCEVSLWLGEQFASDVHAIFPRLNIKVASSNKLLGLMGQEFPLPCSGFMLHEETWKLDDAVVLLISHSGGTFAPLACANLLQAYTKNIFAATSEFDTQIGKQLRQLAGSGSWNFKSFIFTTDVGLSACEPCSLSVVAMHQLLTQVMLYMMRRVQHENLVEASGDAYLPDDYLVMEELNARNIEALEDIVACRSTGEPLTSQTNADLTRMGVAWAQHVLETPRGWIIVFLYIMVTVIWGHPLVSGIAGAAGMDRENKTWEVYLCLVLDALIYVFSPQWACLLLRLFQGRALRHRMTGRTIVVGDIPWVSQSADAFLSKLFACSYSATAVTVLSANPADHLVHRLTHRVVRGVLLACGRPDGRLYALTSAENAVSLAVNQASSIQSIGSTCESVTVGHNGHKLPLTRTHMTLPGSRRAFLCEEALMQEAAHLRREEDGLMAGTPSSTLLGAYGDLRHHAGAHEVSAEKMGRNTMFKKQGQSRKEIIGERSATRQVAGTGEQFYGENLVAEFPHMSMEELMEFQRLSIRLYETRVASLQRTVAFFVMFHALGKRVQDFWPAVSFGLLGYDMSRTHSIMRIATTASPVSGAEVRDRTVQILKQRHMLRAKDHLSHLLRHRRAKKRRASVTAADAAAALQSGVRNQISTGRDAPVPAGHPPSLQDIPLVISGEMTRRAHAQ